MTNSESAITHIQHLTGYEALATLYKGERILVYRALRTIDQTPVVIKTSPPHLQLRFSDHLAFRNQFTIGHPLEHPGLVPMLTLEPVDNTYALVMEDGQGISLADFLQSPASLENGLQIAVQLADILHYLSQQRVIHKDIKPANILVDPESLQVKLIDFSIASLLPKETQDIKNPNVLEGTLAYMAPEQTGRMNRGIDFRTDFYGLGVTLFEVFARQRPFEAYGPIDWLQCHIAKQPPSLMEFGVSEMVAAIVSKLMAKNAEDRYQSALGLKHDLERCLTQWQEQGAVEIFELGGRDVCDRILIPEKLYGRSAEVQTLLDAFDRVAQGSSELLLVAGFSGVGKTAVVNEVHKPITRQQGYFIKGKFDQFNRNIPFSAFFQAFRSLMGQLLGESDVDLGHWKTKILEAVGESGQVLIEVIPELEHIIDKQPTVPDLSGTAAQNRFNLLFGKFIQIFTTPEHPLVMFLDDLQWADSASLNLLKLLIAKSEAGYLLILGAYRDHEVFSAHPLMMTLDEIEKRAAFQTLILRPLSQSDMNVLVADTLHCESEVAAPLTHFIYGKTQGNPFFTHQFFLSLYDDGYITYEFDSGHWQCDLTQVRQLTLTDDVVGFMVGQLQKLPNSTQEILKIAACIGNQFELNTLSVVCEQPQDSIAMALWSSLPAGLVIPESETYKFFQENSSTEVPEHSIKLTYHFLHDRVQQAAYSLIPEAEKAKTHYQIGKLLSHNKSPAQLETHIFAIVSQLNRGQTLLTEQSERDNLAQLNLMAGLRSQNATAYKAGFEYANIGLSMLGEDPWHRQYQLTLKLSNLATELAFLIGDYLAMESLAITIQKNTKQPAEKSSSIQTQIQFHTFQKNFNSAILIASTFLEELGFSLPQNINFEKVKQEYWAFQPNIKQFSSQYILELPLLTDPKQLAIANTLISISVPAIVSDTNLVWFIILALVKLSLESGNSPYSAYAYASYGILINLVEQDLDKYYQFGQLSLEVVDLFEKNITKCRVLEVVGAYTIYLKSHLRSAGPTLEKSYLSGLESGDFEYGSAAVFTRCQIFFFSGELLPNLQPELCQGKEALDRLNQPIMSELQNLVFQVVLKLTGQLDKPYSLGSKYFEIANIFESLKIANDKFSLQHFYLYEIYLKYLFSDRYKILSLIEIAQEYLEAATGWLTEYIFYFYESLVYLDHIGITAGLEQEQVAQYLEKVHVNQNKFARLAASAPMNFQHKYDLVEAEKSRILGHKFEALEQYDAAIAGAKEHRYIQEEALANELAAQFYLSWDKEKIASVYMQEAYHCYARWGAKAKIDDLEQRYPELLQPILQQTSQSLNPLETLASLSASHPSIHSSTVVQSTHSNLNTVFDFAAVLKSAQALSKSLNLDELLERLASMMLQNSGADRLVLLLPEVNATWSIRVTATSETTQLSSVPFADNLDLPVQLIQYVKNAQEVLVVDDLGTDLPIIDDYLQRHQPRSVLCLPILYQGNLSGLLYLQNQATAGVFSCDRITILNCLCSQAAIALENARLYQLEQARVQQLKLSENRFRTLFEQAADPILLLREQGFIDCNQAAVDLFQYSSKADLLSRQSHELSPERQPDGQRSIAKAQTLRQEALKLSSLRFEWLHQCSTGELFWTEVTLTPITHQGEVILHCICRDIRDRKQLEQEQARLTAVLEATPDFIGIANTTGQEIWCNQQLRELRPDLTTPSQHGLASYHPEWVNDILFREAFPTAIEQGSWSGEMAILDVTGHEIPISQVIIAHKTADGTVENFSTIMRDIRDRKRTTAALHLSEARANAAFEQAAIGFAETDMQTKKLVRVNTLFCKMTGYTPAEFAEMTIADITHPEDINASLQAMQRLYTDQIDSFTLEKRYVRKDGTSFWSETTVYLTKLQGGQAVYSLGIIQDISDRKATEKALSLTKFAVENAATSILWINESGRFLDVNKAACQSLGYAPEELMQKHIWEIDPNFSQDIWPKHWQTLKQTSYQQFESHHQAKDHSIFPVEVTSNYLEYDGQGFIFAQVQNIKERKQAERALLFTQYSVDNAADCIFWIKPDGGCAYANRAACKMHDYSIEELMLLSVFDLNPDMTFQGWDTHWQHLKRQGSYSLESNHQTKNGRLFPVEVVVNFLEFEGEEYNFARVRDISDRKAAELALKQLNTELEQRVQERTRELSNTLETLKTAQKSLVESEKMAALGNLVAGVAHEINTPIGTSITVASTLADETDIFLKAAESGQLKRSVLNHYTEIVQKCSTLINSNLGRAGDLIQSFKQVAVDQTHQESRTFNLLTYLQEVVISLQPQVKQSGHQLQVIGDTSIAITSDPGIFAQVVTNLVSNSIKHAYLEGQSGQLQLYLTQEHNQIILYYSDDGCGIPAQHHDKIYEPFFTTARHQGGTGLGLNIVYNIVTQALQGTIKIHSQESQGTTFVIVLPFSSGAT